MPKPKLTRETAWSAAIDAGNQAMRKAGRTQWDEADYLASVDTFSRLFPDELDPSASVARAMVDR